MHILRIIISKHEENVMFENAQIEVPVRALHPLGQDYLARLATQGRGGFKRLRAFRRH